ncbi:MAG TPA: hypothetical protein VN283_14215 [Thiobacillus sp.]|nr:hypothetical protein [Thiobacillus sp.]
MQMLPEPMNRQDTEHALDEPEHCFGVIPPEMQGTAWQPIGALRKQPQEARWANALGA